MTPCCNKHPVGWPAFGWIFLGCMLLSSCGQRTVESEIMGTWASGVHKTTVRTTSPTGFRFVSDTARVVLTIHDDQTVTGKIGGAYIANGRISTNWFLPADMTGVAYTIECELSGRIFRDDPLAHKEVEFWIGPDFRTEDWELRYTTGGAQFPMGFYHFSKRE